MPYLYRAHRCDFPSDAQPGDIWQCENCFQIYVKTFISVWAKVPSTLFIAKHPELAGWVLRPPSTPAPDGEGATAPRGDESGGDALPLSLTPPSGGLQ